ncbi:unnamed protein product [Chrysoparadoxa australica]
MQGWRVEMEDAHTIVTDIPGLTEHAFVAVYDGHGGSLSAKYAGQHMMDVLKATASFKAYVKGGGKDATMLEEALKKAFLDIDAALRERNVQVRAWDRSGCTAIAAIITPKEVIIAHAGDSRAILISGAAVVAATSDHKPNNPEERARIEAAGGCVSMKRVDGDLAVSRALGDFQYKDYKIPPEQCKVTALPDVLSHPRSGSDECLIMCCDGIWDVMTNDECKTCVAQIFTDGEEAIGLACEELLDLCLFKGSRDNMSAVIVAFPGCTTGKGEGVLGRRKVMMLSRRSIQPVCLCVVFPPQSHSPYHLCPSLLTATRLQSPFTRLLSPPPLSVISTHLLPRPLDLAAARH